MLRQRSLGISMKPDYLSIISWISKRVRSYNVANWSVKTAPFNGVAQEAKYKISQVIPSWNCSYRIETIQCTYNRLQKVSSLSIHHSAQAGHQKTETAGCASWHGRSWHTAPHDTKRNLFPKKSQFRRHGLYTATGRRWPAFLWILRKEPIFRSRCNYRWGI